ncbi:MAG: nicotinate-nucleotide--dimethylbenzimidazole phosphoribosyltransferase, partial [Chloroflexota bacterium]
MKITIPQLDEHAMQQARDRQDTLLKPKGALGELETLSIQLAGVTGRCDWLPQQRAVLVFAGDHGVMAHNVSSVPQAITAYMVNQFMAGQAAVNVL